MGSIFLLSLVLKLSLSLRGDEERNREAEKENSAALLHSLLCLYVHVLFVMTDLEELLYLTIN